MESETASCYPVYFLKERKVVELVKPAQNSNIPREKDTYFEAHSLEPFIELAFPFLPILPFIYTASSPHPFIAKLSAPQRGLLTSSLFPLLGIILGDFNILVDNSYPGIRRGPGPEMLMIGQDGMPEDDRLSWGLIQAVYIECFIGCGLMRYSPTGVGI